MDNKPTNQNGDKQKPVMKGKVYVQKDNALQKLYHTFFSASPSEVVTALIKNVLVPDALYTLNNMWKKSGDMFIYGVDDSKSDRRRRDRRDGHYDYSGRYRNGSGGSNNQNEPRISAASSRADYWKTIEFERKGDAEDLLDYLRDELDVEGYDYVRVDTLLEFANLTSDIEPIHTKWGWDDLTDARVEMGRGGKWRLVMPKMIPVD